MSSVATNYPTDPKASVLVTVFNRENYLAACLESVLASTWTNFEIIVVDDTSTDSSLEIAREYAKRDDRIKVFRNDRNLGDYPNRNRAAQHATGDYLKYVDADDIIYPHTLRLMMMGMTRYPEAALGLSWNVIDPPLPYPFISPPEDVHKAHFLGVSLLGVGPSASIIRKDAFNDVGTFRELQLVGDTEMWLRLTARWPLVSFPPALVWWRRHQNQETSLELADARWLNIRYEAERRMLAASSLLSTSERGEAEVRMRHRFARQLISRGLRQGEVLKSAQLWQQSDLTLRDGLRGFFSQPS